MMQINQEVINAMGTYRVNARVIADDVDAGSPEGAVEKFARTFSGTLMVISATAKPARKGREN